MTRHRFSWLPFAVAVLGIAFIGGPRRAAAQAPAATDSAAQPPRLDTLEAALPLVRRTAGQPPLLVVDAANVRPAHGRMVEVAIMSGGGWSSSGGPVPQSPNPPVLVPGSDGTLALRDAAAYFGRRIAPVGSLSVLAPTTMVVLNDRPGRPDLFAGLSRGERLQMLLAAFTPGQWRKLGGANGLGAGDFSTPAQRDLFLSLLPYPFRVRRQVMTSSEDGKFRYPQSDDDLATLSPGQRAAVRLTLARRTTLYVPVPLSPEQEQSNPQQRSFSTVDTWRERPDGAAYLETASNNETLFAGGTRTLAYGALLRQEVPARAKPGELAFESARLDPPIPLENTKTLGDLVKRAGTACRLELYADARLAALPTTVIGDAPIRAGDALRALSLAVTGAFRKVSSDGETAYVLSDNVEGLGTRQARLTAWSRAAGARATAETRKLRRQIAAQKPDQYVAFAPGDPHALPDALLKKITATPPDRSMNAGRRPAGVGVNLSDLPPEYQRLARDRATIGTGRSFGASGDVGIRPGQVGVQVKARLAFFVPGRGIVEDTGGDFNDNVPDDVQSLWQDESAVLSAPQTPAAPPPPLAGPADLSRLPASVSARTVIVWATEPAQAAAFIEEAGRRGLNHLWLALPDLSSAGEEPARALLAAAIQAGTKNKVAVSAVLPLLRSGPRAADAPETDDLDRNVQGETTKQAARRQASLLDLEGDEPWRRAPRERLNQTGDLLRVDLPENASRLQSQLAALVATPGLAGLVFEETAASGYADPNAVDLSRFGFGEPGGFGYTPALRLRFLRQASLDPIDLSDGRSNRPLELPFFPAEYGMYAHRGGTSLGTGGVPATTTTFSIGGGQAPETSPGKAWGLLRHEVNRRFLADLHAGLHAARPDLTLFLAERGETPFWFSRWERADALPYFNWAYSEAGQPPAPPQQARKVSSQNLLRIAPDPADKSHLAQYLMRDLPATLKDWNGVVFDLRNLPADDALTLLRSAFTGAKTTATGK